MIQMKKIDVEKWKEFCVGDLFDIHPTKAYNLTNAKLIDNGKYPVVVNSAYNNGIGGYSSKDPTEKGNMITFSDTVDANTIFYQEDPFIGYAHVQGLYPKEYVENWNRETLLFFASSFRKTALSKGFDYGNKFRRDIATELNVKLPVDEHNDPDWDYMINYVQNIEEKVLDGLNLLERIKQVEGKSINISNWKMFPLEELFDITKGSRLTKADMKDGKTNYVGASSFNNGITYKIGNTEHIHPANTLTVTYNGSDIGRTFFQEEPFWATDDVNVLYPKFKISKEIALFLAPIIKAVGGNHVYKDKWQISDMKQAEIPLPVDTNGKPNWKYMEEYMQRIGEKVRGVIEVLQSTE